MTRADYLAETYTVGELTLFLKNTEVNLTRLAEGMPAPCRTNLLNSLEMESRVHREAIELRRKRDASE